MNSMHLPHLEFENSMTHKLFFLMLLRMNNFTSDSQGHYDIDGVSLDSDGVIVASDESTIIKVTNTSQKQRSAHCHV
jgi:hypothetical protein